MKIEITNIDGSVLFEGAITPGKEGVILGNDRSCDVYLPYLAVAQRHVSIQHASAREAILTDLGSAGAVQVNGRHLQPGFVAHVTIGDKIQLAEGLFLSIRPGADPEIPAIGQEEGMPTVFPFFIERNERLVKEIFTELRTQLPTSARSVIKSAEDRVSNKVRELSAILEVSFALNSVFNYQRLIEYVLDMAQKVSNTERGAVLLFNEEIDRLETVFLRGGSLKELEKDLKAAATDVLKCFRTGEMVFFPPVNPTQESMRSKRAAASEHAPARAVALAPLRNQSGVIGVLYLDRPYASGVFTPQCHDL
ncbi:MAG TPA: FHA domain-containing protein, partial [Candidatus Ozemobacteraceae bacterium]|nr:FHA domain-containing protein [Candidatus Ozemobacteraceae bacterium]